MIGSTRTRVNLFMNKFRKLGFIEYNGDLKNPQLTAERGASRLDAVATCPRNNLLLAARCPQAIGHHLQPELIEIGNSVVMQLEDAFGESLFHFQAERRTAFFSQAFANVVHNASKFVDRLRIVLAHGDIARGSSLTSTTAPILPNKDVGTCLSRTTRLDFLDVCREKGIEPYRSFSGRFQCAPTKPETLDGQSCPPSARSEALRDR